jgi:DNA mismatch repair protein MutL
MEIEPGGMDVNIHPSKTEIKFEDEGVIFEIISACVKEAIGEGSFIPSIDFDTEGAPEIPVLKTGFGSSRTFTAPKINYDPLFNPFDEEKKNGAKWNSASEWNNTREDFSSTPAFEGNPIYPVTESSSSEGYDGFFSEDTACANPLLVVKGKYILTTVKSGLMLIDIGRARERIYYERYLGMITSAKQPVQEQMFPETIDLDHNSYHLLMENAELTETLGFDIRPFGENCIVVYGTPATFAEYNLNIKESIDTIIASLEEVGKDFEKELKEKIAMEMVKKSTVSRPAAIGNAQAQELIDSLFACSEPNRTPQGNPVMAIITMDELQGKL